MSVEEMAARFLSEQGVAGSDQLSRFLGLGAAEGEALVDELAGARLVNRCEGAVQGWRWVWLKRAGVELAGTGFPLFWPKTRRARERRRAVNEVRLALREKAGDGRWVSAPELRRAHGSRAVAADAEFLVGGQRHAIVVLPWSVEAAALRARLGRLDPGCDLTVLFCSRPSRAAAQEIAGRAPAGAIAVRDLADYLPALPTAAPRPSPSPGASPLAEAERGVLELLGEQRGAPRSCLGGILGWAEEEVEAALVALARANLVNRGTPAIEAEEWVWLSGAGEREVGIARGCASGLLADLETARALCAVRLWNAREGRRAEWIARAPGAARPEAFPAPRAVLREGGGAVAIELELAEIESERWAARYERRLQEYERVWSFCAPRARGPLQQLGADRGWERLEVRLVPEEERPAASPGPRPRRGRSAGLRPVALASLPQEAVAAIERVSGEAPVMLSASRRVGGGAPRWQIVCDDGVWRVSHSGVAGWCARPEGEGGR